MVHGESPLDAIDGPVAAEIYRPSVIYQHVQPLVTLFDTRRQPANLILRRQVGQEVVHIFVLGGLPDSGGCGLAPGLAPAHHNQAKAPRRQLPAATYPMPAVAPVMRQVLPWMCWLLKMAWTSGQLANPRLWGWDLQSLGKRGAG